MKHCNWVNLQYIFKKKFLNHYFLQTLNAEFFITSKTVASLNREISGSLTSGQLAQSVIVSC